MTRLAILVTIISLLATSCTWRQAAGITAAGLATAVVACTGNDDAMGLNEMIAGDAAQDLIHTVFDATNSKSSNID